MIGNSPRGAWMAAGRSFSKLSYVVLHIVFEALLPISRHTPGGSFYMGNFVLEEMKVLQATNHRSEFISSFSFSIARTV
jgi:hypothetical protein